MTEENDGLGIRVTPKFRQVIGDPNILPPGADDVEAGEEVEQKIRDAVDEVEQHGRPADSSWVYLRYQALQRAHPEETQEELVRRAARHYMHAVNALTSSVGSGLIDIGRVSSTAEIRRRQVAMDRKRKAKRKAAKQARRKRR